MSILGASGSIRGRHGPIWVRPIWDHPGSSGVYDAEADIPPDPEPDLGLPARLVGSVVVALPRRRRRRPHGGHALLQQRRAQRGLLELPLEAEHEGLEFLGLLAVGAGVAGLCAAGWGDLIGAPNTNRPDADPGATPDRPGISRLAPHHIDPRSTPDGARLRIGPTGTP